MTCTGDQLRWLKMVKDLPSWIVDAKEIVQKQNPSNHRSLTPEEQKRLDAIQRELEIERCW
jgi:hypothetical protein